MPSGTIEPSPPRRLPPSSPRRPRPRRCVSKKRGATVHPPRAPASMPTAAPAAPGVGSGDQLPTLDDDSLLIVASFVAPFDFATLARCCAVCAAWRAAFLPLLVSLPRRLDDAISELVNGELLRRTTLWRERRRALRDSIELGELDGLRCLHSPPPGVAEAVNAALTLTRSPASPIASAAASECETPTGDGCTSTDELSQWSRAQQVAVATLPAACPRLLRSAACSLAPPACSPAGSRARARWRRNAWPCRLPHPPPPLLARHSRIWTTFSNDSRRRTRAPALQRPSTSCALCGTRTSSARVRWRRPLGWLTCSCAGTLRRSNPRHPIILGPASTPVEACAAVSRLQDTRYAWMSLDEP